MELEQEALELEQEALVQELEVLELELVSTLEQELLNQPREASHMERQVQVDLFLEPHLQLVATHLLVE